MYAVDSTFCVSVFLCLFGVMNKTRDDAESMLADTEKLNIMYSKAILQRRLVFSREVKNKKALIILPASSGNYNNKIKAPEGERERTVTKSV